MGRHNPGRPTTSARGYGKRHQDLREHWKPYVAAGRVECSAPVCKVEDATGSRRIARTAEWDLGHDEKDRRKYAGPQHAECNRSQSRRAPAVVEVPPLDPSAPFDASQWD